MTSLTQTYLKSILSYDPLTGLFTYLFRSSGHASFNTIRAGKQAGCKNKRGYISIKIKGKSYLAHRLAWLYQTGNWPPDNMIIDHRNGVTDDNKWSNLILRTNSQNIKKSRTHHNSKSGTKGVTLRKDGKWTARICSNGQQTWLGTFGSFELAKQAREQAEKNLGGVWSPETD